jgi:hypothetical protein
MTFFYELKNPKGIKNIKLSQDVNVVICTKKIDTIAITIALLKVPYSPYVNKAFVYIFVSKIWVLFDNYLYFQASRV